MCEMERNLVESCILKRRDDACTPMLVCTQKISGKIYKEIIPVFAQRYRTLRQGVGKEKNLLLLVYSSKMACPCPSLRPVHVIPIQESIRQGHFCPWRFLAEMLLSFGVLLYSCPFELNAGSTSSSLCNPTRPPWVPEHPRPWAGGVVVVCCLS